MGNIFAALFLTGLLAFGIFVVWLVVFFPENKRKKERRTRFEETNKYWKPDDVIIEMEDYHRNPRNYTSWKLVTWKPDGTLMIKPSYSNGEDDKKIVEYAEGWVNASYNARKQKEEKDQYILESLSYVDGIENFQKIIERTQREWQEKAKAQSAEMAAAQEETLKEMFKQPLTEVPVPKLFVDAEEARQMYDDAAEPPRDLTKKEKKVMAAMQGVL